VSLEPETPSSSTKLGGLIGALSRRKQDGDDDMRCQRVGESKNLTCSASGSADAFSGSVPVPSGPNQLMCALRYFTFVVKGAPGSAGGGAYVLPT
jgi:hypothetical protein